MARAGADVRLVTPERTFSPDVGTLIAAGYIETLARLGVPITTMRRLRALSREAGAIVATLGVDGSDFTEQVTVDAVVAEAGTESVADLYDELVPHSTNGGAVDLDDLLAGRSQALVRNPDGRFQLFRIGDAVASRNVQAAILDAARLCRAI